MKASLIALAAALTAAPALAADWNADEDGTLDVEEFVEGDVSAATFNRVDDDDDGALSPDEVGLDAPTEAFDRVDTDGSGAIEQDEAGTMLFAVYDADDDDALSDAELDRYMTDEESGDTMLDQFAETGPRVPK